MSTYMPKAADISRNWYVLDADGKTLGSVAAEAATLLRGKHKPTFAPHADCGDHVIVINAGKIVQYKTLMAEKPEFALKKAVKGMLPDNSLGRKQLTRLRIFKDGEHTHEAQKPEVKEF